MSVRPTLLTDELRAYMLQHSLRDEPLLAALREETKTQPEAKMQVSAEQGQLMAWLVKLISAKKLLEIGTFTGYSALVVMLAAPKDAKMICCDVDAETAAIAKKYWQQAGLTQRIDLRLAPALETLQQLEKNQEQFDYVFIDADKENYVLYYEHALKLTRSGGIILIDNIFMQGRIIDMNKHGSGLEAVRQLNQLLLSDQRVDISTVPIGDGMTILIKR